MLRKRLRSGNPQKQFLAVHLASEVLTKCAAKVKAVEQEILLEVASVAAKPSRPGTSAGKRAKELALEVLRGHGEAGQNAFRTATGLGKKLRWVSEQEQTQREEGGMFLVA